MDNLKDVWNRAWSKRAREVGNEHATPEVKTKYPLKTREEMSDEFTRCFDQGVQYADFNAHKIPKVATILNTLEVIKNATSSSSNPELLAVSKLAEDALKKFKAPTYG